MYYPARLLGTWWVIILALLAGSGCDKLPFPEDPEQRPLITQLADEQRQQWRKLPLEGAHNFRDLGGYTTSDGRTTKWGMIYRSSDLSELTDRDLAYLQRLHIKQVVDFRSDSERAEAPDRVPEGSQLVIRKVDVAGTDIRQTIEDIMRGDNDTALQDFLIDANRDFAIQFTPVYKDWMHSLTRPDALPQVYHCTAGKDRTGFATAILLLTLGVPEETVINDYLLTNTYSAEHIEDMLFKIKLMSLGQADVVALRSLLGVEEIYLRTALTTIKETYGSFDLYLDRELGIDEATRNALKQIFLE